MCVKLNKHFNDALFPSSSSSSFYNANDAISVNYIADIPAGSDHYAKFLATLFTSSKMYARPPVFDSCHFLDLYRIFSQE